MILAVGLDVGGSNVRGALIDLGTGELVAEHREALADRAPAAVADQIARVVERVDPSARRGSVGIGFAGMLRGQTGVVANAPNFGWRDVDLGALLSARLGTAVLANDVNAIAWGEACYGAARGARDVLCVFVGTGVGAGIIAGGRLIIGADHLAGELGHVKVVPPTSPAARPCGCGQRGCLEAYASGTALRVRMNELGWRDEDLHAGMIDRAARQGDPQAKELLADASGRLGLALANAVTLLNPSRLVLGGGVWSGCPELRRLTLEAFAESVSEPARPGLEIVDAELGDRAGVLGAASLAACQPA